MTNLMFQEIVTNTDEEKQVAAKRRRVYMRPFYLFTINSLIAEVIFLVVGCTVFTNWEHLPGKLFWTIVACPLGMGGLMGGLINTFVTDYHYGNKAALFTGHLSLLTLGICNVLCWNLDHVFHFFGSHLPEAFWWWNLRYPMIWIVGYLNGRLLFTEEGQKTLTKFGL